MGWNVLREFQGRSYAIAGDAPEIAAASGRLRWLHVYPSVDNPASSAVCRRVGFTLVGECDFQLPRGTEMRSNDRRLDLAALDASN